MCHSLMRFNHAGMTRFFVRKGGSVTQHNHLDVVFQMNGSLAVAAL